MSRHLEPSDRARHLEPAGRRPSHLDPHGRPRHLDDGRSRGFGSAGVAALALGAVLGIVGLAVTQGRPARVARHLGLGARESEAERWAMLDGRTADELRALMREPETLREMAQNYATVTRFGDSLTRWDAGRAGSWTMRGAETAGAFRWTAEDEDAPLRELEISFGPARGKRDGAVITARLRVRPTGAAGRLASAAGGVVPAALATHLVHGFKALVEAGEVPTTEGQPAARRNTH